MDGGKINDWAIFVPQNASRPDGSTAFSDDVELDCSDLKDCSISFTFGVQGVTTVGMNCAGGLHYKAMIGSKADSMQVFSYRSRVLYYRFVDFFAAFKMVRKESAGVNRDFLEAAKRGDVPAVKAFIANGANVNEKYNKGFTSLIFASMNGHLEVVQALLDKGADVNATMNDGSTALSFASKSGHQEVRKVLINAGAK